MSESELAKAETTVLPAVRRTPDDPIVAEFVAYVKAGGFQFEHVHKHTEGGAEIFLVMAIKRG